MGQARLRGVRKSHDSADVIKGIDLDVRDGGFLVFVGPSGCGKSTTLRRIAGLESITEGELLIDGVRANGLRPEHLHMVTEGQDVPATVELAEHLRDVSILHLRVDGVDGLPSARVGAGHGRIDGGRAVGLMPDETWALAFGTDVRRAG